MRMGIDLGGTKIEGIAIDENGVECERLPVSTPKDEYVAVVRAGTSIVLAIVGNMMSLATKRPPPDLMALEHLAGALGKLEGRKAKAVAAVAENLHAALAERFRTHGGNSVKVQRGDTNSQRQPQKLFIVLRARYVGIIDARIRPTSSRSGRGYSEMRGLTRSCPAWSPSSTNAAYGDRSALCSRQMASTLAQEAIHVQQARVWLEATCDF